MLVLQKGGFGSKKSCNVIKYTHFTVEATPPSSNRNNYYFFLKQDYSPVPPPAAGGRGFYPQRILSVMRNAVQLFLLESSNKFF